jgi:hypothetical protein
MAEDRVIGDSWSDPIVAEVRRAREALFAEAHYDIYEFFERLSARQAASGHQLVKPGALKRESE